jgi:AcrR family transcriptional regulator
VVVTQARAVETRHTVIAAAAEIFEERGYGNTSLSDVIDRAGVTKGAFYYHFGTKEALAAAIIEQANNAFGTALDAHLAAPSPMLEKLIQVPFIAVDMMRHDQLIRVGYALRMAADHVTLAAGAVLEQRRATFVGATKTAIAEGDIKGDIDPEELGHTIWASVTGTHVIAAASHDNIVTRLAQVWRIILAGTVTPASLPYFTQFLTRVENQYTHKQLDAGHEPSPSGVHPGA